MNIRQVSKSNTDNPLERAVFVTTAEIFEHYLAEELRSAINQRVSQPIAVPEFLQQLRQRVLQLSNSDLIGTVLDTAVTFCKLKQQISGNLDSEAIIGLIGKLAKDQECQEMSGAGRAIIKRIAGQLAEAAVTQNSTERRRCLQEILFVIEGFGNDLSDSFDVNPLVGCIEALRGWQPTQPPLRQSPLRPMYDRVLGRRQAVLDEAAPWARTVSISLAERLRLSLRQLPDRIEALIGSIHEFNTECKRLASTPERSEQTLSQLRLTLFRMAGRDEYRHVAAEAFCAAERQCHITSPASLNDALIGALRSSDCLTSEIDKKSSSRVIEHQAACTKMIEAASLEQREAALLTLLRDSSALGSPAEAEIKKWQLLATYAEIQPVLMHMIELLRSRELMSVEINELERQRVQLEYNVDRHAQISELVELAAADRTVWDDSARQTLRDIHSELEPWLPAYAAQLFDSPHPLVAAVLISAARDMRNQAEHDLSINRQRYQDVTEHQVDVVQELRFAAEDLVGAESRFDCKTAWAKLTRLGLVSSEESGLLPQLEAAISMIEAHFQAGVAKDSAEPQHEKATGTGIQLPESRSQVPKLMDRLGIDRKHWPSAEEIKKMRLSSRALEKFIESCAKKVAATLPKDGDGNTLAFSRSMVESLFVRAPKLLIERDAAFRERVGRLVGALLSNIEAAGVKLEASSEEALGAIASGRVDHLLTVKTEQDFKEALRALGEQIERASVQIPTGHEDDDKVRSCWDAYSESGPGREHPLSIEQVQDLYELVMNSWSDKPTLPRNFLQENFLKKTKRPKNKASRKIFDESLDVALKFGLIERAGGTSGFARGSVRDQVPESLRPLFQRQPRII